MCSELLLLKVRSRKFSDHKSGRRKKRPDKGIIFQAVSGSKKHTRKEKTLAKQYTQNTKPTQGRKIKKFAPENFPKQVWTTKRKTKQDLTKTTSQQFKKCTAFSPVFIGAGWNVPHSTWVRSLPHPLGARFLRPAAQGDPHDVTTMGAKPAV